MQRLITYKLGILKCLLVASEMKELYLCMEPSWKSIQDLILYSIQQKTDPNLNLKTWNCQMVWVLDTPLSWSVRIEQSKKKSKYQIVHKLLYRVSIKQNILTDLQTIHIAKRYMSWIKTNFLIKYWPHKTD